MPPFLISILFKIEPQFSFKMLKEPVYVRKCTKHLDLSKKLSIFANVKRLPLAIRVSFPRGQAVYVTTHLSMPKILLATPLKAGSKTLSTLLQEKG